MKTDLLPRKAKKKISPCLCGINDRDKFTLEVRGKYVVIVCPECDRVNTTLPDEYRFKSIANEVITFGKYKGKTFEDVYKENKKYLIWLRNGTDKTNLGDRCWYYYRIMEDKLDAP